MHEQGLAEEAPRLPRWSMKMEQRNNICALACVHHMRCQLRFRKSFRARRRMRFRHFNLVGPPSFGLKNFVYEKAIPWIRSSDNFSRRHSLRDGTSVLILENVRRPV